MARVFKSWSQLRHEAIQIAAEGTTGIFSAFYAGINALYEAVQGTRAPGTGSQTIQGHDHTGSGGGAIMPRGSVFCFDNGGDMASVANYWGKSSSVATADPWDYDTPFPDASRGKCDFWIHVTDGVDGTLNNNSATASTLEAQALIYTEKNANGGGDLTTKFKITNLDTGTSSTEITQTTSGSGAQTSIAWFNITDIPIGRGGWQEYKMQTNVDYASTPISQSLIVRVLALNIVESRAYSQPASAGANLFDSIAARGRP